MLKKLVCFILCAAALTAALLFGVSALAKTDLPAPGVEMPQPRCTCAICGE